MYNFFTALKGKLTNIEFIDTTSIKIYHNIRILRHKTFDGITQHEMFMTPN